MTNFLQHNGKLVPLDKYRELIAREDSNKEEATMSYQDLRKLYKEKTGNNPVGKTKDFLIEALNK